MQKTVRDVLIVEDEGDVADTLKECLLSSSQFKFEVQVAVDPKEMLDERISTKAFDVCIVDLQLDKGLDGFFGLRLIQTFALKYPDAVLIVYSGNFGEPENVERAMLAGAVRFIPKTVTPAKVVPTIEELLSKSDSSAKLHELLVEKADEWQAQYPGQVIAVAAGEVKGYGEDHVAAMVKYRTRRYEDASLPEEPILIEVPHPQSEDVDA